MMDTRKFVKEFADNNEGLYRRDLDAVESVRNMYDYSDRRHHDAIFEVVQGGYLLPAAIEELGIDEDSDQAEDILYELIDLLVEE